MKEHSPLDVIVAFDEGRLSEERIIDLIQSLIDDGSVWRLQGFYGRLAHELIEAGHCTLGPTSHRDFYGNRVPSRDEVEDHWLD